MRHAGRKDTCFVHDEVVKRVVMGDDEILLDVHQVVDADPSKFRELLARFFKES